jgi:hypothetical protein
MTDERLGQTGLMFETFFESPFCKPITKFQAFVGQMIYTFNDTQSGRRNR